MALRAAEADAEPHAARRPIQRARHGRRSQVGRPIRCCPRRWCAKRVWREWLPDIYLNPHGYPSHEWVQQFAGYVPPGFRSYLVIARLVHERDCAARSALSAVCSGRRIAARSDRPTRSTATPTSARWTCAAQARYRRWAFGFEPYVFNQEIYKDTAIYYSDPETASRPACRRLGAEGVAAAGGDEGGGGGRRYRWARGRRSPFFRGVHRGARRNGPGPVARVWRPRPGSRI